MNTRLVCDTKHQQLVLFGGDAQSHYLSDTWIFDLKTRTWRQSRAVSGPEARAGHFTVYDPETGKQYSVEITIKGKTLAVRGYIGTKLMGKTVEWSRASSAPPKCSPPKAA